MLAILERSRLREHGEKSSQQEKRNAFVSESFSGTNRSLPLNQRLKTNKALQAIRTATCKQVPHRNILMSSLSWCSNPNPTIRLCA